MRLNILIEEAYRLEEADALSRHLAKKTPEEQIAILNALSKNAINNHAKAVGTTFEDGKVLGDNDVLKRMSDINYINHNYDKYMTSKNKEDIAKELKGLHRRLYKTIDNRDKIAFGEKYKLTKPVEDQNGNLVYKPDKIMVEQRKDRLTSPKQEKPLEIKDIYGYNPNSPANPKFGINTTIPSMDNPYIASSIISRFVNPELGGFLREYRNQASNLEYERDRSEYLYNKLNAKKQQAEELSNKLENMNTNQIKQQADLENKQKEINQHNFKKKNLETNDSIKKAQEIEKKAKKYKSRAENFKKADERHKARSIFKPAAVKAKRYLRTHPKAKKALIGAGALGTGGLGYAIDNAFDNSQIVDPEVAQQAAQHVAQHF